MRKNRMMPFLTVTACSLIFIGCSNDIKNGYYNNQQVLQEQANKLVEQCNNYNEIQVNLESGVPGLFCSVYTENPYDENGSLVSAPILVGLTPISTSLSVGKGVENLYIVSSKGIVKKEVADINVNLSTESRSIEESSISENLLVMIDKAFPEISWNLKESDLYFNTDLRVKKPTNINITYVSDGLPANSNNKIEGLFYLYTYPEEVEYPTVEQCTFYGLNQETGELTKLEGLPSYPTVKPNTYGYVRPLDVPQNYIFSNIEEKASKLHRRFDFGTFDAGVKIGFMSIGLYDVTQKDPSTGKNYNTHLPHYCFTTPCLNDATHSYGKTARNNYSFIYKEPTCQGCIKKVECDGKTYFVLGMENSFPDGNSYDADYNDILCIMELDPDAVETLNTAPESVNLETYKYARGYYLFEDNYPEKGDYDFNDVVIQYEIKTYVNRPSYDENCNEVKVALLAYGCDNTNEFGFYVGDKDDTQKGEFNPVFTGINGYVNVTDKVDPSKFKYSETFHFPGKLNGTQGPGAMIRPYLKNNNGTIYDNTFSREGQEYPYVLDIPLETTAYNYTLNFNYTIEKEAGKGFRWCKEGKRLDSAYNVTPKTARWYLKGYKDESLLITREADAD